MRLIQNTSLQGLNIPFNTPNGILEIYLRPKASISIPANYQSKILETFIKRRLIKVTNLLPSNGILRPKYK
jgi:hypothetical protein